MVLRQRTANGARSGSSWSLAQHADGVRPVGADFETDVLARVMGVTIGHREVD